MEGKVTQVTIVVKDQEAALEFYIQKVGFEKKTDFSAPGNPRWVTVGPSGPGLEISLYQLGARTGPQTPPPLRELGNGMFVVTVSDVRKAFDEMKSRGVKFRAEKPAEQPWGTYAEFSDPDGNHFTILQPPAWTPPPS